MKTYVVRIAPGGPRMRGVVDEVATGARAAFHEPAELVEMLEHGLGAERATADPPPPHRTREETGDA